MDSMMKKIICTLAILALSTQAISAVSGGRGGFSGGGFGRASSFSSGGFRASSFSSSSFRSSSFSGGRASVSGGYVSAPRVSSSRTSYSAPQSYSSRSYSYSSSRPYASNSTVINNHHYNSSYTSGSGFGNGFMGSLFGSYIGSSLGSMHSYPYHAYPYGSYAQPVPVATVATGATVAPQVNNIVEPNVGGTIGQTLNEAAVISQPMQTQVIQETSYSAASNFLDIVFKSIILIVFTCLMGFLLIWIYKSMFPSRMF